MPKTPTTNTRVGSDRPQLATRRQLMASGAGLATAWLSAGCGAEAGSAAGTAASGPSGINASPLGLPGAFRLVGDYRFGRGPAANIRNKTELAQYFRFRYIYNHGQLDGLDTYWSRHRDYPDGDLRSLHVFEQDCLVLKARVPSGGGLRSRGIESGMLRALIPVTPGMVVEMRARLPHGLGTWPAFWLNPGVERPGGKFSSTPWPPEIDIFEFFDWQGRDRPRLMTSHIQTAGKPERYGNPHDTFSLYRHDDYDPGVDFSAAYHTFALDWQKDEPAWIVDGKKVKQTHYVWSAPPAHILITNQIGTNLKGVNLAGMTADEAGWDYRVAYLRVWQRG